MAAKRAVLTVNIANKGFPAFAARTRTIADGAYEISVIESLSGEESDVGRVQLAAQAPAMARLLLELMNDPDLDDYAHGRAEAVLRAAGVLP